MRSIKWLAFILFCFALGSTLPAQSKLDFSIENKTAWRIDKIFLSPFDKPDWGANVLDDDDVLEVNEVAHFVFNKKEKGTKWDIKCVDVQGVEHIYEDVDLSKVSKLVLRASPTKGPYAEIQ